MSLSGRETQIQPPRPSHGTPAGMGVIKETDNEKCRQESGDVGAPARCRRRTRRRARLLWETFRRFLKGLSTQRPRDPAIPLAGNTPEKENVCAGKIQSECPWQNNS